MSKSTKPALRPVVNNLTDEEKELQVARYLANEKKTYFQLILSNLIHNAHYNAASLTDELKHTINASLDGADYIIEKLYPVEKKED